jgi:hypothetical protein
MLGQKIAAGTKAASYSLLSFAGLGVLVYIVYILWRELFCSDSAVALYSDAFENYKNDSRLVAFLGEDIRAFGSDQFSRHARRRINHYFLVEDGKTLMRLSFVMQGVNSIKANVFVEYVENPSKSPFAKKWLVHFAMATVEAPRRTFILEDNRESKIIDGMHPDVTNI